jgi:hypothetical protein
MKAAAVNASILSAEFVRCFTALLHSDHAIDAYHGISIAPLSKLRPRSAEGASGAGERRRSSDYGRHKTELDQGRVILIDNQVASARLIKSSKEKGSGCLRTSAQLEPIPRVFTPSRARNR